MKNLNIRGYMTQYVFAVITVIFGVVMFVIPFSAAKIITSLIALCFIYLGITPYQKKYNISSLTGCFFWGGLLYFTSISSEQVTK